MTEAKKSNFSKAWIVVAAVVIITGILLILSVNSKNLISKPTPATQIKEDSPQTSLDFSQARIASASGIYEIDVHINSGSNVVNLAQLEMSYNPKKLARVSIRPGTFLNNPVVIQNNVDPGSGRIKFWLGLSPDRPGSSGQGTLATITFAKVGSGSAQIIFLPKTSVTGDSNQSILKNTTSAIINILPKPTKASSNNPNRFTFPTRALTPTQIKSPPTSPIP